MNPRDDVSVEIWSDSYIEDSARQLASLHATGM